MTVDKATEIKEILLQIKDSIPATYVDRIFHYYQQEINPSAGKPCTCTPKHWQVIIDELKAEVEKTLNV